MKKLAPLLVFVLVAAACSSDSDSEPTSPPPTEAPQAEPPVDTEAPTTSPPATEEQETTTIPVETAPEGDAAFALTQVVFGDSGYVVVTNVGNGTGDVGGHWICQRPAYFAIPSTELAPGESVWVAAEDGEGLVAAQGVVAVVPANRSLGAFSVTSGEAALFASSDFGDSAAIVDYVEWGSGGHGRASVAVEAGIWPDGGFVEVPEEAVAISGPGQASTPQDWAPDIGV